MIRVGAYALAAALAVLAAVAYLLAASYLLQGPRARADLGRFQALHDARTAVVEKAGRDNPTAPLFVTFGFPPGTPRVIEADPYGYAADLRPGDSVTLLYWKGRVAEVLTPHGTIETADDPRVIAEDSNAPSVIRTIGVGLAYSLVATGLVVAARRWTAPLFRR